MNTQQRGGTLVGLIVGIVAGLGIALAVAAYINKVPVPFVARTSNSAEQDAAEAQRNRHWNPNATLQGQVANAPPPVTEIDATDTNVAGEAPAGAAPPATTNIPADTAAPDTDPLGELLAARTARDNGATAYAAAPASAGTFQYFVQAGAFRSQGEADAQRARLAMLGWEARVSELEQNGSTLYRVRVGPFARRDDAEQLKQGLDGAGVLATLVRTPRG